VREDGIFQIGEGEVESVTYNRVQELEGAGTMGEANRSVQAAAIKRLADIGLHGRNIVLVHIILQRQGKAEENKDKKLRAHLELQLDSGKYNKDAERGGEGG
jgi:hypothetical protein